MINFRYHVVSLTAVFLALAIGLVVGTAALNGPVADSLKEQVTGLRKSNDQWRDNVASLEKELKAEEDFAAEIAQTVLPTKLAGRRVLVVSLPTAERNQSDGVVQMLKLAGATVTGRVAVQDKFFEPDNNSDLLEVADRAAQPSIPAAGLPGNSDGVETSSALLSSALVDRAAPTAPVTEADRKALLSAYSNAGYLAVDDKITGPAEAVVIISGQAYVDKNAQRKDDSVLRLAVQLDKNAALVIAGNGAGSGNVVAGVRGDPTLSQTISTVDNSTTTVGQLVAAMATIQQVTTKKAGQYGMGAGVSGLTPKLTAQ
ncbi:copper transporter [Micromonospora zhanjiangensis]|uniref:Copper transporter n=1 Tax=Micromonospora zhanjiangensis TaxID=1522057 RepID=A0ABV8KY41_9ACTN